MTAACSATGSEVTMIDPNAFETAIRPQAPAIAEKLMTAKYGRKSVSADDDARYRREIEVAADAAIEVVRRYLQMAGR